MMEPVCYTFQHRQCSRTVPAYKRIVEMSRGVTILSPGQKTHQWPWFFSLLPIGTAITHIRLTMSSLTIMLVASLYSWRLVPFRLVPTKDDYRSSLPLSLLFFYFVWSGCRAWWRMARELFPIRAAHFVVPRASEASSFLSFSCSWCVRFSFQFLP